VGTLAVDRKKLYLGSTKAKNRRMLSPLGRTGDNIAANTLVQVLSPWQKAHLTATVFAAIQRPNVPDMPVACG
jgi:hypothetical protein